MRLILPHFIKMRKSLAVHWTINQKSWMMTVMTDTTVLPITLIVPTYNEEHAIASFLKNWLEQPIRPSRLLIVDDSVDGTPATVARFSADHPWIECHHNPVRLGLTGSVAVGVALTTTEWVSVMDGDGQHPPQYWGVAAQQCSAGVDLVLMRRATRRGKIVGMTWGRTLFSVACRTLARCCFREVRSTHDPLGGFFFCRRSLWVASEAPSGWKILLDLLVKAPWSRAVEVPYEFAPREAGVSKASLKIGLGYLGQLWRLWIWRRGHAQRSLARVVASAPFGASPPSLDVPINDVVTT